MRSSGRVVKAACRHPETAQAIRKRSPSRCDTQSEMVESPYFYVYTILFKRVFTTRLRDNNDRDDLEMELGT
jgi:hypothetical protein